MALAMSRPHKHPKTGVYWIRKRVPADLVPVVGKAEVTRSLGTKDRCRSQAAAPGRTRRDRGSMGQPARRRADADGARSSRLGGHDLRELALPHRNNPSEQYLWHTELFEELWTAAPLPEREPEPGQPGELPIENVFLRSMRQFCFQQADFGLDEHGLRVDAWSRFRLAKAIGAALQRASIVLECESRGVFAPGEASAEDNHDQTREAAEAESKGFTDAEAKRS
jgi:hypothetical protein